MLTVLLGHPTYPSRRIIRWIRLDIAVSSIFVALMSSSSRTASGFRRATVCGTPSMMPSISARLMRQMGTGWHHWIRRPSRRVLGGEATPLKQAAKSKQPALSRVESIRVGYLRAHRSAARDAHGDERSRRGAAPRTTCLQSYCRKAVRGSLSRAAAAKIYFL